MGRQIKQSEFEELAYIYNTGGKTVLYDTLRDKYDKKNVHWYRKKMMENPMLEYDEEADKFRNYKKIINDDVFLSMEELCTPTRNETSNITTPTINNDKTVALDQLVKELLGDKLLELNKYIQIDSASKRVIVDKTALTTDGYHIITV
jgi:hypothetical protein